MYTTVEDLPVDHKTRETLVKKMAHEISKEFDKLKQQVVSQREQLTTKPQ